MIEKFAHEKAPVVVALQVSVSEVFSPSKRGLTSIASLLVS
jgi:hypothetical protein